MPAEAVGGVRVTEEVMLRIRELQLWLCDLGAAFPDAVLLTQEGVYNVRCPLDGRHSFLVVMSDDGLPIVTCLTCEATPEGRERFFEMVRERVPGWSIAAPAGPIPVTGWQRQPAGSPVVAVRELCNGTIEALHDPERAEEVAAWMESQ